MIYDYRKGIEYAKNIGINWQEEKVENFDQMAKAHGFSQAQVDLAIHHFLIQISRIISPKSHGFFGRIKIGVNFIFGKI